MTKKTSVRWLVMALVITGLLLIVVVVQRQWSITGPQSDAAAQLELTRTALAATENLDSLRGEEIWSQLYQQLPQDRSIALNRALNRVLLVDSLTESTTNALLDAEAKQSARQKLPAAIEQARAAINDFATLSNDPVTTLWLSSRIDLQEASLLPASVAKSLRRELFVRLAGAVEGELKADPKSIILGGPLTRVLDELESPMSGLPAELRDRAAVTIDALSEQHPDNLFIALRAARLNIDAKSPRASETVRRTLRLALAIEPTLRVQTQSIGLTPDELIQKIIDAIDAQDWQAANNQMLLWFNVLNSTELVKTDRRRVSPHPLDRLNFDALRRLSAEVAENEPIVSGVSPIRFSATPIGDQTDAAFTLPVDLDLDLDPDLLVFSLSGLAAAWENSGQGDWQSSGSLKLDGSIRGALVADLFMVDASDPQRLQTTVSSGPMNSASEGVEGVSVENTTVSSSRHSTFPSVLVFGDDGVQVIAVDGRRATQESDRLSLVTNPTGLEDVSQVSAAVAGDLDGDGDLDLVLATRNHALRVFINRGNRTFFEAPAPASLPDDQVSRFEIASMAIVDLDRDLDLDIVMIQSETGRVGLLENLLHLQFRYRDLSEIPATAGATRIQIADLDGNVSWDLFVGGGSESRVIYSHTADAGAWTVDRTELVAGAKGSFLLADFDNDSWMELLSASRRSAQVRRLAGMSQEAAADSELNLSGPSAKIADFNADGKLDVVAIVDGKVNLYQNQTQGTGHHLEVRFRGIDDNNANSGRVNHYAVGSVIELRFGPHYRAKVITEPSTHFGLDGFDQAASLRVIFPNGLTQTVREPAIDTVLEEEQTLKGSCPYLYAWNGEEYAFVTDCLWAAPLGLQVARGVVAKDRPWEYLKIDGDQVRARDGKYELRITEELWEVAYFDQLSLAAVDHPRDVVIWTNEKVGPAEIAEPKIYAFQPDCLLPLARGQDTSGKDVTAPLSAIDRQFVQGFDRRIRQGLCPPHWIDLDFGPLPETPGEASEVYLVLTGWILPTDTSLNIQIDQNPELPAIEFPSLWVPDATRSEGWRKAIPFMGFPGGKTKTIVVEVTEILNPADPRLRIRTSAQMYWDSAQLAVQAKIPAVRTHAVPLIQAQLQYHGFSARLQHPSNAPDTYDYSRTTRLPKWPPLQGRFTQFGDCRELLQSWDDSMVVMGSGDEMRLTFDAPAAALPEGWKRDFVLHCVGWDKDADLNTLTGQSSDPLPFKSMTQYPPSHAQADQLQRVHKDNEQHLNRNMDFRKFWYR